MEKNSKIKKIMAKASSDSQNWPYVITKWKVTYWFNHINKLVFNNKLPKFKDIIIEELYDKVKFIMAECECFERSNPYAHLHVNTTFKNIQFFIQILAHEMVHLYQWIFEGRLNHSKKNFLDPWKDKFAAHGIDLRVSY